MENLTLQTFTNFWSPATVSANILVSLNMLGALLLGLLVGYERSYRGRAAGMRTYGLVCMASCAVVSIIGYPHLWYGGGEQLHANSVDPSRVIQGIVSGIGFLGAGVIMRDGLNISGLTTAASIWTVSAIGILVGVGFYAGAMTLTILSFISMMWGAKVEAIFPFRHALAVTLSFQKKNSPSEDELRKVIIKEGYDIAKGSFGVSQNTEMFEWHFVVISLRKRKSASLVKLSQALTKVDGVQSFKLIYARN